MPLSPLELIILCVVGLLVFGLPVAGIVAAVVVLNRAPGVVAASPGAVAPRRELWERIARGARIHFFVAVFLLAVLPIFAGLSWTILGNSGMPLVRLATVGILLTALYAIVSLAVALTSKRPF